MCQTALPWEGQVYCTFYIIIFLENFFIHKNILELGHNCYIRVSDYSIRVSDYSIRVSDYSIRVADLIDNSKACSV